MAKTTRVHVAVSRRHPMGAMRRAGVSFTMAGAVYDLTDDQLEAVEADPMLVVSDPSEVADDLRAKADALATAEGDDLAGKSKLELLAVGQDAGLWADAPDDEAGRKAYVKTAGTVDAMREAIIAARAAAEPAQAPAELPQDGLAGELAALSDEDLAAYADEQGVILGEYEDDDVTYPDVTGDRGAIIARIVEIVGEVTPT